MNMIIHRPSSGTGAWRDHFRRSRRPTVSVGGRAGRNNRLIGVAGLTLAVAMIGLTYAAAPFYRLLPRDRLRGHAAGRESQRREATGFAVGFDANVAPGLDWSFEPESESVRLRTGKTVTVFFRARNLTDKPTEARATFNVSPEVSGEYFDKISCFCFTTSISARTKARNGRWCSSSIRRSRRTS